MDCILEYERWKKLVSDDEVTLGMERMSDKEKQLSFSEQLRFGTGGVRAIMGPGPNRLNLYTVRKISEGFANYLKFEFDDILDKGIVIAYDNRHNSKKFAMEVAKVFALHKIKTYLFDGLRPTPELSFAIRHLHASGGVVITASHNTKEYNGYKVYNSKGCQCIPAETDKIIKYINDIADPLSVKIATEDEFHRFCVSVGEEIDELYYDTILKKMPLDSSINRKKIKIVYSPLHGTGYIPVTTMYDRLGYSYVPVINQSEPLSDFANTKSPNPENPIAFEEAKITAKNENADIIIATDPDCDRLGVMVKHLGEYVYLTGNQTGAILLEYILRFRKEHNTLPVNGCVINTIVTSNFGEVISREYGMSIISTLTGFKFIGDKIGQYEESGEYEFVFGYEESCGYLIDPLCRDKDGVQSCVMLAEVANYYAAKGLNLIEVLNGLYNKFGYFCDELISIEFSEEINSNSLMKKFRELELTHLSDFEIFRFEDYEYSTAYEGKVKSVLDLPKSSVLKYILKDGSWVAIRPSGTEPKCKCYFSVIAKNMVDGEKKMKKLKKTILDITGA